MDCEYYVETGERVKGCRLQLHGGEPRELNCLACIKAGENNESYAKRMRVVREPTIAEMKDNFITAVSEWSAAGFPVSSKEQYAERAAICGACEFWDPAARFGLGKCNHQKCGCTKFKFWMTTSKCPADKWPTLILGDVDLGG